MTEEPLLSVRNLEKHYPVRSGLLRRVSGHVKAVDGISFDVRAGETLGLVGESGCGKSTAATTLLGLEESTGGAVRFDGEDVTALSGGAEKRFRRRAGMIFQDPTTAFDPRMTVGESVAEPLAIHGIADADRRQRIVADLLERVGLDAADLDRYPGAFSGGQKQRIALARSLVLNPDLLVADEPVSALDVSVQAEILSLIDELQSELGLSVLFISHDLGVVRQVCDRVAVMYLGEIVEKAPVAELFADPQHPYTEALLASIPDLDPTQRGQAVELTGDVPDPSNPPTGCSFHPRCPRVIPPEDVDVADETFRHVLDLRLALESGDVDPDDFDDPAGVREEFDLPPSIADDGADDADGSIDGADDSAADVLERAIGDVAVGETERAAERLAETFSTVCEREEPALLETDTGAVAACHRHDAEAVRVEPARGERTS